MHDPQQTNPWYREPWPWILMAAPVAAVVGGIITAFIAVANDDPLVVDNYYKEGLAINQVLERDRAASERGYQAQVLFSEDRARVRVHLVSGSGPLPGALELRLIHPTKAALDRRASLKATQAGWYEGSVSEPAPESRWKLQLEGEQRDWRLTGEWRSAEGNAVVLQPRG
jgi:hypothetical protein